MTTLSYDLLTILYIIIVCQACFNAFAIIMWVISQNSISRSKEQLVELKVKLIQVNEQLTIMATTLNTSINQSTKFFETFLKPDPKLLEFFRRQMEEKSEGPGPTP